mmetsp:Transcript_29353/g.61099  ORF Transcript_29353/g.61099 Transcript_29353/m.61099 type:complete len:91 (+) Transcript_29353:389-661(+)
MSQRDSNNHHHTEESRCGWNNNNDDDDDEEEEEEEEKSPSSPSSSLEAETLTEQSSVFCVPPGNAFVVSIVHHGSSRANYKCGREAIDVY